MRPVLAVLVFAVVVGVAPADDDKPSRERRARAALAIAGSGASAQKAAQPVWEADYDAGMALARKERRPAVVLFTGKDCAGCKELEAKALRDPRVVEALRPAVLIAADGEKYRDLATRVGVTTMPTIVLVDKDGVIRDRLVGVTTAERVQSHLKALAAW
jgi:thiol:disulfide interchange protein